MQIGIWNGLTRALWLWGSGHIKIQTPGSSFCKTRWLWANLCQQDIARCSMCRDDERINITAAQMIDDSRSAWGIVMATVLYSILFYPSTHNPCHDTQVIATLHHQVTFQRNVHPVTQSHIQQDCNPPLCLCYWSSNSPWIGGLQHINKSLKLVPECITDCWLALTCPSGDSSPTGGTHPGYCGTKEVLIIKGKGIKWDQTTSYHT